MKTIIYKMLVERSMSAGSQDQNIIKFNLVILIMFVITVIVVVWI